MASIERALTRMKGGTYAVCLGCGNDISVRRLQIIPYTNLCSRCARENDRTEKPADAGVALPVSHEGPPIDYESFSDKELENAIYDSLQTGGQVPLEELEITCRGGTVYLKGALPGKKQREILRHLLEDVMGLKNVIDDTRIDRLLWQRPDRTRGTTEPENTEDKVMMEGETIDEDTFHSRKAGTPVSPPATPLPEREK